MDYDITDHMTISSRKAFDGRIIEVFTDVVRLPDGRTANWERVKHPGAVGMVPLREDGRLVLVRQYRHPVGRALLEVPAGKLDAGEQPDECARRELAEEVGYRAGELLKLGEFFNSPGYSDEYFHIYLARSLEPCRASPEADEFLKVETVGIQEALGLVSSGGIRDAKTIIGVSLTRLFLLGEALPYSGPSDPRD